MLIRLLNEKGMVPVLTAWFVVGAALVFKVFMEEESPFVSDLLSLHWALAWVSYSTVIKLLLATGLLVVIGFLVRVFARRMKLGSRSGNLELLLALLMVLSQVGVLYRTDVLVTLALSTFLFFILVSTDKQENVLSELFHTGLLLSLASLFVGQAILMVLALYFAIFVLRPKNWRERIVPFLGVGMVGILISLVVIWSENPILQAQQIIGSAWVETSMVGALDVGTAIILIFTLPAAVQLLSCLTAGTISDRNYSLVLFGWFTATVLMSFVLGFDWRMAVVLASFPLSVYIGRWLASITRWWLADLILLVILTTPMLNILWPI